MKNHVLLRKCLKFECVHGHSHVLWLYFPSSVHVHGIAMHVSVSTLY